MVCRRAGRSLGRVEHHFEFRDGDLGRSDLPEHSFSIGTQRAKIGIECGLNRVDVLTLGGGGDGQGAEDER